MRRSVSIFRFGTLETLLVIISSTSRQHDKDICPDEIINKVPFGAQSFIAHLMMTSNIS